MGNEEVTNNRREKRPEQKPESFDISSSEKKEGKERREEEVSPDQQQGGGEQRKEPVQVKAPSAPATPSVAPVEKDPVLQDLEGILAEDLTDVFLSLPDDKKVEFKQKGEETAKTIKNLIDTGKVRAKRVFALIREWLRIIPGVNTFFLRQEAKIRADKVMQYAQDQLNQQKNEL